MHSQHNLFFSQNLPSDNPAFRISSFLKSYYADALSFQNFPNMEGNVKAPLKLFCFLPQNSRVISVEELDWLTDFKTARVDSDRQPLARAALSSAATCLCLVSRGTRAAELIHAISIQLSPRAQQLSGVPPWPAPQHTAQTLFHTQELPDTHCPPHEFTSAPVPVVTPLPRSSVPARTGSAGEVHFWSGRRPSVWQSTKPFLLNQADIMALTIPHTHRQFWSLAGNNSVKN